MMDSKLTTATKPYGVVYGLYDPRDGALRYVGQTTRPLRKRLDFHLSNHNLRGHRHSSHWLSQLRALGLIPQAKQLAKAGSREELDALEIRLIAEARVRGDRLTNHSDGGGGSNGLKRSEETKNRIRQRLLGCKRSEATRSKLSAAKTGQKLSEATKKKISETMAAHPDSAETRKKKGDHSRGKPKSDATRGKISVARMGHVVSEDTRTKISVANTGKVRSDDTRARISAAQMGNQRGLGRTATAEAKLNLSIAHKGLMAGSKHPHYRHDISTEDIIAKLRDGLSRKQVAEALGIDPRQIGKRLKQAERAGVADVPKSNRGISTSLIQQRLAEGVKVHQIAKEFGLAVVTVYLRLRKARSM